MKNNQRKGCVRVLVADDEDEVCRLLTEYTALLDCRADAASDGKKALEYLDSKAYDFVFLDCDMPELSGIEVARYLKGKRSRPKVVMMTGYGPISKSFAQAAGVDIYLKKPLMLDDIKKIIRGEYRDGG